MGWPLSVFCLHMSGTLQYYMRHMATDYNDIWAAGTHCNPNWNVLCVGIVSILSESLNGLQLDYEAKFQDCSLSDSNECCGTTTVNTLKVSAGQNFFNKIGNILALTLSSRDLNASTAQR